MPISKRESAISMFVARRGKMTEYKVSAKYKTTTRNEGQDDTTEIDVVKLLKALWKKIWIILLVGILVAGAAYEYSVLFIKPSYQSSAKLYVDNGAVKISGASISISGTEISTAQKLVNTYIEILKTRSTLERVIEEANLTNDDGSAMSYDVLLKKISASAVNSTEIFEVTVTDNDPERAKLIANTIVIVLPYQISSIIGGSTVKTVDWAIRGVKTGPSYFKNALIGFLIGIVAVSAVIIMMHLTDNYIHDEEYLLENYNLPLLAVIPDLSNYSGNKYGKYKYQRYGYGKYGGYKKRAYGYYRVRVEENDYERMGSEDSGKKN